MTTMFFENLDQWGDRVAVIDAADGKRLTYRDLETQVNARIAVLGASRKLIFIAAQNTPQVIVDYLAALRGGHVVHLLESLSDAKAQALIEGYGPNLLISGNGEIQSYNPASVTLHPDLALLLSTSGSTGSAKFVKLSHKNIHSNAVAIAEYLALAPEDRALSHLKLHYSYGISILNSHLVAGAALILTHHSIIEPPFWLDLKQFEATSFAGVPYTFETLLHTGFDIKNYPSLKYITQAGGKLEANLVKRFAEQVNAHGVKFFVMYGQTEAAPRISYLPPELAVYYPGTIGRAIPGGRLLLVDEQGQEILAEDLSGELAYEGPNVMMGYAERPGELSTDETPDRLLTGDIAFRTAHELFTITGRTKRFVKPFGLRVNLDEIQSTVKQTHSQSAVTGDDKGIVIALEGRDSGPAASSVLLKSLVERYGLPETLFKVVWYEALPLLPSGKYDFKIILENTKEPVKKPTFLGRILKTISNVLELETPERDSILELYRTVLANQNILPYESFDTLQADSLSFVSLSVGLEECLGPCLPSDWQSRSIQDLEELYKTVRFG